MQLIDILEERSDKVLIEETPQDISVEYNGGWQIFLDKASFQITKHAFDTLLNILRIPIKYIERCVEGNGTDLAQESVNFWLSGEQISFLMERIGDDKVPTITQVFPGKRIYLPGVKVNDLIVDYLIDSKVESFSVQDDVFTAVYLADKSVDISGEDYKIGVRVLYSDCFNITPRFDGVLYDEKTGGMLTWPTIGRKFRVASNTISQIVGQIYDFLELSMDGLMDNVVESLREFDDSEVNSDEFVKRLTNDLRMNQRVRAEIVDACQISDIKTELELIRSISSYVSSGSSENIDPTMARSIQLALSNYIVTKSFK